MPRCETGRRVALAAAPRVRGRGRRTATGLTTVELLLVVALLGIVAGLAVPRFGAHLLPFTRVETSAQDLVSRLRLARRLAVVSDHSHRLILSPSSPPYTGYRIEEQDGGWSEVRGPFALPDSVTATGDRVHQFDSLGRAAASTSVTLSGSAGSRTVRVLAATGRAWVEAP